VKEQRESADDIIQELLRGIGEDLYGAASQEHVIEIYKSYLEMTDRISARRTKVNSFFLAVNTALITLSVGDIFGVSTASPRILGIVVPASACVICYLWHSIICSFRHLNSAKFKVIHAIEQQLPIRPYFTEWESLERGTNPALYRPFSHIEGVVPWLFMTFHVLIGVQGLPWTKILSAL